ncbi:MAG: hypothetical protein KC464_33580, partial [Myxococcales bacterium]|nr:hypothetical protein [Myxococcales bacterium]
PAAAPPPAAAAPPVVLGWQQLVLERNAVCGRCNEILPRGSDAAVAVVDGGTGPRPVICIPCVEELRHAPQRTERPDRGPDRAS